MDLINDKTNQNTQLFIKENSSKKSKNLEEIVNNINYVGISFEARSSFDDQLKKFE